MPSKVTSKPKKKTPAPGKSTLATPKSNDDRLRRIMKSRSGKKK